ncbi:MAG TPA: neutral zinc metallopeptidase [Acetobacteraceae bacterium]|jgi:predicted metalloprotease|nr:neutral zinc metallopeptidase [Acetobacteraceae bacterium]
MQEDDLRESANIEDRRGFSMGGIGAGGLGIGAVIVLTLIGWATGIDPSALINGAEQVTQTRPAQQAQVQPGTPSDDVGRFVARILGETEDVWSQQLPAETGRQYEKPILVLFSGATASACGAAQSAMGPFYCPRDRKLYLDTSFFGDMQRRLGGGGDFAYAYVIAHEVGHHVQNLLGLLPKVQAAERQTDEATANNLSVRTELMADCLAGAWANHMNARHHNLDQRDLEQAVRTASAIGDDRLSRAAGRAIVPDSFTHGSSEQRVRWLTTGFRAGTIAACNTFEASR